MRGALRSVVLAIAVLLAYPAQAQTFPELTGRVVDAADVIPPQVEAELTQKLEALEAQSQRQLVVATVPSLEDYPIEDYGYQLGRKWGLGDAERNDGALLLIAPNDRKVRIEVGYGLEPVLTDGYSTLIVQNNILPRFRDDDITGGIVAGTDAIISQLTLPESEAMEVAQSADRQRASDGGFPIGTLFWLGFMFFFFILPMFRGGKRRRYRGGRGGIGGAVGDIILWEAGKAVARGLSDGDGGGWGGGGFGGGGFNGGGGFSGGGGSFGGGGASGGW